VSSARRLRRPCSIALPRESGAYAKILEDQQTVRHACEAEASMMLAAVPDCVRRERISEAFRPESTRGLELAPPLNVWKPLKDLTPIGVVGDARKASVEKGEKLLDVAATLLAEKLVAGEPWN
jgi:creatinine amidohydrolase